MTDHLQTARQNILNTILYGATGFGVISFIVETLTQLEQPTGIDPYFWIVAVLFLASIPLALVQRLSYQARAWGLLAITYGLGVYDTANFSYAAGGFIYFFATIALSGVLFGDRRTLIVSAICLVTLAGLATAITHGTLPLIAPATLVARQHDSMFWVSHILVMHVMTIMVIGGVIVLLRHLQRSIHATEAASDALREANQTLECRVEERTAALATATAEARRAQTAAEEANDVKSKFIANMSHELRTPLNAIINFTSIVASGMRGPVTAMQIDYLERVQASGEHLLGMINDILDISKIEAGRLSLYKEPVHLGTLVQSTLSSAVGLTKDKPITLNHEIATNLPTLSADKTRIRQVLLNLLSNATKFTDVGSITARVWRDGNEVITSITDTGTGIPSDKFGTIFEEFRQADEGSSRSYQGTGLGLPICKRLIEMHNGRIWLESEVGVGSTFFFSLPLVAEAAIEAIASPSDDTVAAAPHDMPGTPILVVDNDPATVEIIRTYLQPDGYVVHSIGDSRIVLDEARRLAPAIIILDIMMPHKDGWEVLTELKTTPDLRDIPVVCYTIVDNASLGISLGANAYLVKPIEANVLRETVSRMVGTPSYVLVIDDDPNVCDMVSYYLSQQGYEVDTAANGREGLEHITIRQPNLIILDLMMPELDGFGVIEYMGNNEALSTIPVLVLTAKDLTPDERQHLTQRVQGLHAKAKSSPTDILTRVRTALHKQTPL